MSVLLVGKMVVEAALIRRPTFLKVTIIPDVDAKCRFSLNSAPYVTEPHVSLVVS